MRVSCNTYKETGVHAQFTLGGKELENFDYFLPTNFEGHINYSFMFSPVIQF
jgi:hypothetical protein